MARDTGAARAASPKTPAEYYDHTLTLLPRDGNGNPRFVSTPRDFNETVRKLGSSGSCILLCSVRYIDYVPPVQAISFRVFEASEQDWYTPSWGKSGARAPKGVTLAKLLKEAGGNYLPSDRVDDQTDPNVWRFTGRVVIRAMNGRDLVFSKDRLLDLRPGAPEFEGMRDSGGQPQEARRRQARQAGAMVCETKAQLRAIRAALGVEQSYSLEDTLKPFVLPVLVPNPDMTNPVHANFMLAHAMGHVEALYGRRALPPAPVEAIEPVSGERFNSETGEVIDGEVVGGPDPEEEGFGDVEETTVPRCSCPCKEGGCGAEISVERADETSKRGGAPRCRACWPSRGFDYERHKNLADLGLSKPTTPGQAREWAK